MGKLKMLGTMVIIFSILMVLSFVAGEEKNSGSNLEFNWAANSSQENWYDPVEWTGSMGGILHENDWYESTYHYLKPYDHFAGQKVFGYFEEPYPALNGFHFQYDYFTQDWYDQDGIFETWWQQ